MKKIILTFVFTILFLNINLLSEEKEKWNVLNPVKDFKAVSFEVDEGTWMNLDVSPDGKEIVFDMLGDIYIIPISGGTAKALRQDHAWEVQPRFSPDGKYISFTSDRDGADNIWYMKKDGSELKQITKEDFRLLNNAVWTPDGNNIIARKHFTSERSAGAGEMWMYHITGGSGIRLTNRKNDQQDQGEPSISPDGRYVYYSEDMYPGGKFNYNKDPNSQIYVINRFDREEGIIENVTGGPGGAFRPQVSNNGKYLAFVKRVREKTVLYIHNLKTGEEYPIYDKLTKDQQEAWAIFGVYPNFNWTPNDEEIIIWTNGKIHKINIESKKSTDIPFKAISKHKITNAKIFKQDISSEFFNAKAIRHTTTSPDGKTIIFSALGNLFYKDLPNGIPKRVTMSKEFEFEPSYSEDGKKIIYVSWDDEKMGSIHILNLETTENIDVFGETIQGIFRTPIFSDNNIIYVKEGGNDHQGFNNTKEPGIYIYNLSTKENKRISEEGEFPYYNKENNRIYYQTGGYLFGSLNKGFHSIDLNGNDKRTHFTSKYTNRFVPSPDFNWIAFNELHHIYIAPFPKAGVPIDLTNKSKAFPIAKVTKDAGINIHWSADSKTLHWTLGDEYFSDNLTERFDFLNNSGEKLPPIDESGIKIDLKVKADKPTGRLAFVNVKIITVDKNNRVIEDGVILTEDNKIIDVGSVDEVKILGNTKLFDCGGRTVMPGIVDVHAHQGTFRYGLSPQKHWQYYASLAYGITTTHDPSSNSEMIFSQSEMIRAGSMIGPRVFSTGTILYGAEGDFKAVVNNEEDAQSHLRRTKAWGAFSVKSYNQPRRNQRQQIIKAARDNKMMVYPEGGSHFYHNMTMILDGHTGVEHNIPVAPLFDDVINLWANSKTHNTPTLIVSYGAVTGEYYWYQNTNVWENEKLLNFTPRYIIDSRSRHRTMIPDQEYQNGHILISKSLKKLNDAGVKINLGSHGQIQGIGAHWELWMLAQGGMTPMECIRAATMNGAEYLGMEDQIGSIEKGKLADFIVLDKDPLEDIRNSEFIRYTIINGRLFEAEKMFEIGLRYNKPTKFWFENYKSNNAFPWHKETNSFQHINCSCGH